MNIFIHAEHAQAFELLNPPSLGLDGLVKIHAFEEIVTQGDAHDPQSAGRRCFLTFSTAPAISRVARTMRRRSCGAFCSISGIGQ